MNENYISSRKVADMMGISRHGDMLSKIDNIKIKLRNIDTNEYWIESEYKDLKCESRREYLVSKKGCELILQHSRKAPKLQGLIDYIGVSETPIVLTSRFEESFINKLADVLEPLDLTLKTQYYIDGYRIDGYIPELNISIEYDESQHHVEPQLSNDIKRQSYIEDKIGCCFVRCDYMNTDEYNIGLVMKKIMTRCPG